ncbi:hypothetical protein A6R70_25855 [Agrobacterium rubi]|uniref:hypothetical protein n=1 Tax=Agrobacterium rubi TaxID=28099 RepID=UPI00201B85BF|nr:hypothetical protein [Agrobacterium rubi]MCL6655675.1 hypothetical protein [Agrobacterium rubi]
MSDVFKAGAQYDDWTGTAAADNQELALYDLLEKRGLKREGEAVVGVNFYSGEHFISISAYLVEATDAVSAKAYLDSTETPNLRKVDIDDISAEEFLRLFKRFNVVLGKKGLDLSGRDYNSID